MSGRDGVGQVKSSRDRTFRYRVLGRETRIKAGRLSQKMKKSGMVIPVGNSNKIVKVIS